MNFFQKKESTKKEGASLLKSLPGRKVTQQQRLSQTGDQTRSAQEHTIPKSDAFPWICTMHTSDLWDSRSSDAVSGAGRLLLSETTLQSCSTNRHPALLQAARLLPAQAHLRAGADHRKPP